MGTKKALEYLERYRKQFAAKNKKYFMLKCDISRFFLSIDHKILKQKVRRRIKDPKALKIVFDIIDSYSSGIGIGSMTSQVLAIFYLNDLDHFIKEKLKIKGYIRYQDDFLLFSESREYLAVSYTHLIILSICITPIIKLTTLMAVYYLGSALCQPIADDKIVKLLGQIGGTFKLLLAIMCSISVMLIIGVTLVIKISNSGVMMQ